MAKIKKIEPVIPTLPTRKKVAAYARVSVETERLHHSLSTQISYYSELIQANPRWEYVGVYADDGISGTQTKREEFQRMLADCEAGKIDIILTKSISRFARNTVDLLETVRHLKELGIEVRFEKEHINSLSGDGEVMLTLLASFAQEESISISNNVKWETRKRMEQGIPNGRFRVLGYEWENDHLVIVPEEAAIVKRIFQNFLDGKSRLETERELNSEGITTKNGNKWADSNIKVVLTNITYTGNLLLQKEFIENPITKKRKKNKGELPQYFVENTHEPIIDMETFQYVQNEMARRKKLGAFANKSLNITCFTSKIKCSNCGKSYRRSGKKQRKNKDKVYYVWICRTKSEKGSKTCNAKIIPEEMLKKVCAEVLGLEEFDEDIFLNQIDHIVPIGTDQLDFYFYDGHVIHQKWKSTARTDCWTAERRKAWGEEKKGKNYRKSDHNPYTGMIHCPTCGANFRRQIRKYANGDTYVYWHCPSSTSCGNSSKVPESFLKEQVKDILNLKRFNEATFHQKIKSIDILKTNSAIFHLVDGTDIVKEWEPYKREKPKHTEEYKEYMRQLMKERWTDEKKQEMSKRMKKIRSEKKWSSTRK